MVEKMLFWTLFLLLGNFCLAAGSLQDPQEAWTESSLYYYHKKNLNIPRKPENISCIFYYQKNFTCTWSPEKEVYLTEYTVVRIYGKTRDSCRSENHTSCSFFYPYLTYPDIYSIEVEAKNVFGEQKSNVTYWYLEHIVKIEPPTNLTVEPIPGVKHMLQVTWGKPNGVPVSDSYICQLRYRRVNSTNWELGNQRLENERPYNLTGLLLLQQYAISMQCQVVTSELWSNWSEERIGTTEGLAPNSSLDLWRILGPAQPDGGRTVQLLWKEARADPNVRKTLGYNIWYFPENETTVKETKMTTDQQFKLHLGSAAYLVTVVYSTFDGVSPEATLRIPAVHEKPLQCIEAVQVYQYQDHLEVWWQTSDAEVDRWVIEWYPDQGMENLKRSWEFVSQTRNWTGRAENFVPFQCYNISVYPMVGIEVGVPYSIQAYFKEGIPSEGPLAKAQNISTQTATIKWEEIPKTKRRGFIYNYTVFYKSDHGTEFAITVDSSILQYELESLESNTQYTVKIMANTLAGGKNGTSFNFKTSISIIKIVLLGAITGGGLFSLGILLMVCSLNKPKLKRLVCPEIPNPAKSNVVLWHDDNFKSKLHLGEVQFHGKTLDERIPKPYLFSSGDLIDKLVVDFENFLDKTEVPGVDLMKTQESILSVEGKKYVNSPYNFYSPSGQVFQGLLSSALVSLKGTQEPSSERLDEETKDKTFQKPNASEILEPEQQPWEEAGLNPYLKNSVTTREFLTSEEFSDPNPEED
ncbi:interleukin-31 receptor subunit alpha isoform X1 [Sarcophilus harrisii]|uniref:Interleukin 31 receptor A n=1 Tax=Sarcophilus harrisii TaxID=9305 RepID=G3W806_SARHA|nr:interleukin-31 receptor subunit alpha isoform X1 [Sarcophilus harrisii]XP_031821035.1 interleukin-31 receptor subunit alpha isoform X1 [Sarcophilus harrisii]XP_031821042.1 interleukin-31 receptor subunit alpha isoform X1 [Sarcophilus harrisii]